MESIEPDSHAIVKLYLLNGKFVFVPLTYELKLKNGETVKIGDLKRLDGSGDGWDLAEGQLYGNFIKRALLIRQFDKKRSHLELEVVYG